VLLSSASPVRLGVPEGQARLRFSREDWEHLASRYLFVSGEPAFELSFWCGTCPFLFERQGGANGTLSDEVEPLADLERPISTIEARIVATFSALLPEGEYLPLLLEVEPTLVAPSQERDYFAHEQVSTWGVNGFWGLPENPRSFYYRTFETGVKPDGHLYEFVVPMVPPSWNDPDGVDHYRALMARGVTPTAVAVSTLDVCQPADDDQSTDYYAHWGLTHFLLDGHHKLEAAAKAGAKVRLLALVSLDGSLAEAERIARLPELLSQSPSQRPR
jgi:hypothetical protein